MLTPELKARLISEHERLPQGIRSRPAGEGALVAFESKYGLIPAEYRWYLSACGGGVVGAEWLNNISELWTSHAKYQSEFGPPHGWSMTDVFIIGWDGGGNPFGIHAVNGKVLVEDHTFGGIHEVAPSFVALLVAGLVS